MRFRASAVHKRGCPNIPESRTKSSSAVLVQCLALTLGAAVARKINTFTQEWDACLKECLAQTGFDVEISTF